MRDGLGPWIVVIAAHRSVRWAGMGGAWTATWCYMGRGWRNWGAASAGHPSLCTHHFWIWLRLGWPDLPISVARTYYCNGGMGSVDVGGCCGLVCTNAVSAECGTAHV